MLVALTWQQFRELTALLNALNYSRGMGTSSGMLKSTEELAEIAWTSDGIELRIH